MKEIIVITNKEKWDNWQLIVGEVKKLKDVKYSICVGCGSGALRSDEGERFIITRNTTMDELNQIINTIRDKNKCQKTQSYLV